MEQKELEKRVTEIIGPVLKSMGMNLEGVALLKAGRKAFLRIYIDKDGGVTLDDCVQVSREVEAQLDVEDPIPTSYTLEVSSPGLDRPLRSPEEFKRFCGKKARIVTLRPVENQTFFIGDIIEAGDNEFVLLLSRDKKIVILYENISRARLEVTF